MLHCKNNLALAVLLMCMHCNFLIASFFSRQKVQSIHERKTDIKVCPANYFFLRKKTTLMVQTHLKTNHLKLSGHSEGHRVLLTIAEKKNVKWKI